MKLATHIFVFAVVSTFSLTAFGCGNSQAAEQPQTTLEQDHSGHAHAEQAQKSFDGMPAPGTKAYCTVMDSEFVVKEGTESSVYNGKTYVFCCPGCKPKFDENPEQYANK